MKNELMVNHTNKVNNVLNKSLWVVLAFHLLYIVMNITPEKNLIRSVLLGIICIIVTLLRRNEKYFMDTLNQYSTINNSLKDKKRII